MKVKLLISRADAVKAYGVGEVIDVSEDEARRLIEAGKATPVQPKPENTRKTKAAETR